MPFKFKPRTIGKEEQRNKWKFQAEHITSEYKAGIQKERGSCE